MEAIGVLILIGLIVWVCAAMRSAKKKKGGCGCGCTGCTGCDKKK